MFSQAAAFNQSISAWNTAKVTTMEYMFYQAAAFNQDIRFPSSVDFRRCKPVVQRLNH
jgi:surface protein